VSRPEIEVVVAEDAIERLCARVEAPVLAVMDVNTREAAGDRVVGELRAAGADAEALVFEQSSGLEASLAAVERVRAALSDGRVPVAVGSGVITDVVRYAAHQLDRDFVSVPTAASMDGYASSVAPLELDGVKVTYPARAPRAIFADPRVIAAAPPELTRAGLGDLLGKATARVDWLAAHLLYGEPFDAEADELVLVPLEFAAANVEAVLSGDARAVVALLDGLIQSGIAIAIVGSSRPASGCEHHASHLWDLLAARGMRPHALHGIQVGYATRFAIRLAGFAFGGGMPGLRRPIVSELLTPAALEWLGEPTPEILTAVERKQRFVSKLERWPADPDAWEVVRAQLGPALALFPAVERALARAGIPAEPGYLDLDERTLRATFRYSNRLRARYTTLDFLEGQGLLEQAIEAMLAGPD
jgi:glycerol-1-phosphate dehydrogenase [NAD(P)+]